MKAPLIKIAKFTGFLALGLSLLYFAFRGIDFQSLMGDFKKARYSWVILSLGFAMIAYISRAIRWNLIIEPLGYKPELKNTFFSLLVGYLANFAFPRIGEITRCATLGKKEKIPVDKLVGTVIVERVVDLFTLFLLLGVLIIFRFETLGNFLTKIFSSPSEKKYPKPLIFQYLSGSEQEPYLSFSCYPI
ncbi:MAG: flippase-like domain-containing protein [Bacteroidales bacterium]|nr:flippase-like domain-containing protein [Bacteroidales bacterium]